MALTNQLGLYFHIPFCRSKCGYCDFYSLETQERTVLDNYKTALLLHMKESAPFTQGYAVDTIYFGGGTPLLFGHKRIKEILKEAKKRFKLARNIEVTLEANPDSLDYRTMKKLRRMGINRLSIGVQALDDALLARLGRRHNSAEARHAYKEARRAGFDNISVDLIYGIPGQSTVAWEETLNEIVSWAPEHISGYNLKLEQGTPLFEENPALPDDDTQADMYLSMARILEDNGYPQYEISNFSRSARQSRHNMKYWTLAPYLGFGPGAHSDFSGRRYSYVRDLTAYIDGVKNGGDIMDDMELCPMSERTGEYIMLGLRTAHGLSGNEYTRLFRVSLDPVEKRLEFFMKNGYAMRENGRWRLTPKGFFISNQIILDLLEQGEK